MADYLGQQLVRSYEPNLADGMQDDLHAAMHIFNITDNEWERLSAVDAGDAKASDISGLMSNSIIYGYNGTADDHDRLITDESPYGSLQGILRVNIGDDVRSYDVAAHDAAAVTNGGQLLAYYTSDPSTNNVVQDQDAVRVLADSEGRLIVKLADPLSQSVPVADYNTGANVAKAASSNHTYTVALPAGKAKFILTGVQCSSSAMFKFEIKTGPAGAETTKLVLFNTASNPNASSLPNLEITVADTENVLIERTNLDNQAADVYSTIIGKYVE